MVHALRCDWGIFAIGMMALVVSSFVYLWQAINPPPAFVAFNPYTVTEILREEWTDNGLHFDANFVKHGCDLDRFVVVGIYKGVAQLLPYRDEGGFGDTENRTAGSQTLQIFVPASKLLFNDVEIRTRHICFDPDRGSYPVDKIFSRTAQGTTK